MMPDLALLVMSLEEFQLCAIQGICDFAKHVGEIVGVPVFAGDHILASIAKCAGAAMDWGAKLRECSVAFRVN